MQAVLTRELVGIENNSVVELLLSGAVTKEEYENRHDAVNSELSRFIEGNYNDYALSQLISKDLIDSEFPETSFAANLLTALLDEPKEAQLVYELLATFLVWREMLTKPHMTMLIGMPRHTLPKKIITNSINLQSLEALEKLAQMIVENSRQLNAANSRLQQLLGTSTFEQLECAAKKLPQENRSKAEIETSILMTRMTKKMKMTNISSVLRRLIY